MLVDCSSKLRLGLLLDENSERSFSLSDLFGGRSLFGGVDMARGSVIDVIDERKEQRVFAYIISTVTNNSWLPTLTNLNLNTNSHASVGEKRSKFIKQLERRK